MFDPRLEATRDEIVFGGSSRMAAGVGRLERNRQTPRQALETILEPAVARGRCFVLFSGGLDSTLLLSIATHVARRGGYDLPVPVTRRYSNDPDIDESEYQELVIDHLGLTEWVVVDVTGQHDVFAPAAADLLRAFGPQLPPMWWTQVLPPEAGGRVLDPATMLAEPVPEPDATLVTGMGGDELYPYGAAGPLLGRLRRGDLRALRHPRALYRELRPTEARISAVADWLAEDIAWVRPAHLAQLADQRARELLEIKPSYAGFLEARARSRAVHMVADRTGQATRWSGAEPLHPLEHPTFLGAMAYRHRRERPASRRASYAEMGADVMPQAILDRQTKAVGGPAFITEHGRRWLEAWDGSGPDEAWLDGPEVRRAVLGLATSEEWRDAKAILAAVRAFHAHLMA